MRRGAGLLVTGLGVGALAGAAVGDGLRWPAIVAAALGLILLLVGRARSEATGAPAPDGLGTRVQEVLRLAEEQAADHVRAAQEEADRIVTEARREVS